MGLLFGLVDVALVAAPVLRVPRKVAPRNVTKVGDTRYICVCDVVGRPQCGFLMEASADGRRQRHECRALGPRDALSFSVFEASAKRRVGSAQLAGDAFHPGGFDGALELSGEAAAVKLRVAIRLGAEEVARGPSPRQEAGERDAGERHPTPPCRRPGQEPWKRGGVSSAGGGGAGRWPRSGAKSGGGSSESLLRNQRSGLGVGPSLAVSWRCIGLALNMP